MPPGRRVSEAGSDGPTDHVAAAVSQVAVAVIDGAGLGKK